MSFLNPVNEPVLRFSSTDAGAPQINYNARAAGDVKAVLKACLVTGYGTKASAGWTATSDAANVVEFISPNMDMADYKIGIDDGATTSTWYYYYQGDRVNPQNNTASKTMANINKSSSQNGWQLIVSARGMYLIEIITLTSVSKTAARLTFFGNIKSGMIDNSGINIGFWSVGVGAPIGTFINMFDLVNSYNICHYKLNTRTALEFGASNINYHATSLSTNGSLFSNEMLSELFLTWNYQFAAQQPGMLLKTPASTDAIYGIYDSVVNSRPALSVCVGYAHSTALQTSYQSKPVVIYLDYWGY
jgi:hypothetical protein